MPATVVVGTQWGDEGKGKFTDLVAKEMAMVVRYQGGHNAGHTIVVDGERFALQLVPVRHPLRPHHAGHRQRRGGRPRACCSPRSTCSTAKGVDSSRLKVSGNAHLILPYHQELDLLTERRPGQEQARHDQARHRPGLRRQGAARRASGCRTCSTRRSSGPEARPGAEGEERRPGQGLQPAAASTADEIAERVPRRAARPGWRRTSPTPSTWCTRRSRRASTCCSRARRPRSSTSTTAPIRSSPRPTRWPAAPAPAPASGPATSTG